MHVIPWKIHRERTLNVKAIQLEADFHPHPCAPVHNPFHLLCTVEESMRWPNYLVRDELTQARACTQAFWAGIVEKARLLGAPRNFVKSCHRTCHRRWIRLDKKEVARRGSRNSFAARERNVVPTRNFS